MKKLMIIVAILTVGFASAQRGDQGERNLTPEQIASVHSKKMTLVLDLDDKQQTKVEKLLLTGAKERQANKTSKEDRSQLTSVQKVAIKEKMLEKKIAMKREMKNILTADQYARWEKMMAHKGKKKGDKRGKGRKRGDRN